MRIDVSPGSTIKKMILVGCLLLSSHVLALPEAVEMDRLVQAIEQHIENDNFPRAFGYIANVEALSLAPPPKFLYLKAVLLQQSGDPKAAKQAFEQYVIDTYGSEKDEQNNYYWQALDQITAINEADLNQRTPIFNETVLDEPLATEPLVTEPLVNALLSQGAIETRSEYENQLKNLYLTDSFKEALVQHINALLASTVYTGSRVNSAESIKKGLSYAISINDSNEIVSLIKDGSQTPESFNTLSFNPYGKSVQVPYECHYNRSKCVLKMPDTIEDWFVIGYSEPTAQDLSEALRNLIMQIQQSNDGD